MIADDTPEEDIREAEPEEVGDDEGGDPRDAARESAGRQAGEEGEVREDSRTSTGEPRSAGADR
jgi:hypothetical protein